MNRTKLMGVDLEYHPSLIHILPLVSIQAGECEDADCGEVHTLIQLGWLCLTLEIVF